MTKQASPNGQDGNWFSAPRRDTVWLKASLAGREPPAGPLEPGKAYISLDLVDLVLSGRRFGASRFYPLFLSDLSVSTSDQTKLRQSAMIDPRIINDTISTRNADGFAPIETAICAQMPWNGRLEGKFNVLALRSEELLNTLLRINETLIGTMTGDGAEIDADLPAGPEDEQGEIHDPDQESLILAAAGAYAAKAAGVLVGKATSTFLRKTAYPAAIEVAKILSAKDGTYETRLQRGLDNVPVEPGYHVLLAQRGKVAGSVTLDFGASGQGAPVVLLDGKRLRRRDYAIVRVTATPRHLNIEDVDGVGAAWMGLMQVLRSGGQPEAALKTLRRVVALSPYLIDADKAELIARGEEKVRLVRGDLEKNSAGEESLLSPRTLNFAFQTLSEVWAMGARGSVTSGAEQPVTPSIPAPPPPQDAGQAGRDRFEAALAFSLRWEGGFSNHPNDPGGATMKGVTQKVFHAWLEARDEPPREVKTITDAELQDIYWSNYWQLARCEVMPRPLDAMMFDGAVNHGPGGAGRLLQQALNACGESLKVDGAIGQQTLLAVARHTAPAESRKLAEEWLTAREALYRRIVARKPETGVFLAGWLNRLADLKHATGPDGGLETLIDRENSPLAPWID